MSYFTTDDTLMLNMLEVILNKDLVLVVVELLVVIAKLWLLKELDELFPLNGKQRTVLLGNSLVLAGVSANEGFKPEILTFLGRIREG
jgi:hypothetical protein